MLTSVASVQRGTDAIWSLSWFNLTVSYIAAERTLSCGDSFTCEVITDVAVCAEASRTIRCQ